MKIGIWEMIVIAIVALVVLGPDKLPVYAKKLGQALGEIKKYSNDLSSDIKENIVEPLNEVAQPLKDAVEPLNDLQKDIKGSVQDVSKSFNEIGKPKKEQTAAAEVKAADPVADESAAVQEGETVSSAQQASSSAVEEVKKETETAEEQA